MARDSNIELGDLVRDLTTTFEGIVITKGDFLNGCCRVSLQSQTLTTDGGPGKAGSTDIEHVEVITKGVVTPIAPTFDASGIEIGDLAQETVTGFTGVVTAKWLSISGCWSVDLQPRKLKRGQPQKPHFFEASQVTVLEKNVLQEKPHKERTGASAFAPSLY